MNKEAIAPQIQRILASRAFAKKDQLRHLLEFLFEHYDSQARIKPDQICKHLWAGYEGKDASGFIVKPISRLRTTLEEYYADEGREDRIRILLPDRSARASGNDSSGNWITAVERPSASVELEHFEPDQTPVSADHAARDLDTRPSRRNESTLVRSISIFRIRTLWVIVPVAVVVSVILLKVFLFHTGRQPASGTIDGDSITVFDSDGASLWHKSFPEGLAPDYYAGGLASRSWFGDLDGNGQRSVLFLYQPARNTLGSSTTLICYSAQGVERWRWAPGKALPNLSGDPPIFTVTGMVILNARAKAMPRIVVASKHYPLYPSQVALIDANGKTVSEYWHSGHLESMALAQLYGGKERLLLAGIANGYHQATLVVLDPDHLSGASAEESRPNLQIAALPRAPEEHRLLFPRSDLNRATGTYNVGLEVTSADGVIRVCVIECEQLVNCRIWYQFDTDLRLRSAYADDEFRLAHNQYFTKSAPQHALSDEEESRFHSILEIRHGGAVDAASAVTHPTSN